MKTVNVNIECLVKEIRVVGDKLDAKKVEADATKAILKAVSNAAKPWWRFW